MTLTEFITARLDEDEAEAKATLETGYQPPAWGPEDKPNPIPDFYDPPSDLDRKRAARVLADVEAKRRIVIWLTSALETKAVDPAQWHGDQYIHALCLSVQALASAYADHEDYDESWRP